MPEPNREVKKIQAHFPTYKETEERGRQRQVDGEDEDEIDYSYDDGDTVEEILELEEERAVENGAPYARSISVPALERTMIMKTNRKNKEIKVKGKFLMDGPWWNASFKVVKEGSVYNCQGSPTYTLRKENGQRGKTLLQQLLSYVFKFPQPGSADDQLKHAFWVYFEKHRSIRKPKDYYTFHQFFRALEDAVKKEATPDDASALPIKQAPKNIMRRFDPLHECFGPLPRNRDEEEKKKPRFDLRYVYRCFKCPLLFKVLPLLSDRQAFSVLSTEKLSDLKRLESVLRDSPEDLGFYTSMRRHDWGTLEIPFQGFVNAGLIPDNLFKCTAKGGISPHPSPKSSGNQNCTLHLPSTSTANQDTVGPASTRSRAKQVSVKMAKVLKLYDIVKARCREGKHTFLYETDMKTGWRKDACRDFPFGHIREEAFVELQNRNVVKIEQYIENSQSKAKFHWSRYRQYEKSLAWSIETLLSQHGAEPWTLPLEDFTKYNFDPYQQGAAHHVCLNPLTVILGRGGCGKTHVVASIIREYLDYLEKKKKLEKHLMKDLQVNESQADSDGIEEEKEGEDEKEDVEEEKSRVLLTAPTGRAASILKKRTGMAAKTLHSVMGVARKCNPEDFIYSDVEILVVDECSLVPISVLSEVLRTLLCHKLKKVIFLGDPHQLPSIDPGNFLQDIIKVFQTSQLSCIQTLKINHRTDEGGKLIVENARRIAEERRWDLHYEQDRFEMHDTSDCVAGNGQEQVVERLIKTRRQLQDHKNSQVVAFRNVDVKNLNRVCCHHYAAHAPFTKGGKQNHRIGDKICARKNSTIRVLGRSKAKDKKKEEAGGGRNEGEEEAGPSHKGERKGVDVERISNGDTFFIVNWRVVEENDGKKVDIVTLQSMDEEEGTEFEVDFKEMRTRCKVEYAWVRTINTYQGSETDYIVYVLSPNSIYETWQHLYTAITRGRKGCFIVGTLARLKQVMGTNPKPRHTSLERFLRENFGVLPAMRPTALGQADTRTPQRLVARTISSSNRVVTASRPCQWTPRQGQPVRGSPSHGPASSNQATPVRIPHKYTPLGRQEVQVNNSTPNGASTSSATPVQSVARVNEIAAFLNVANLTAPARAVAVSGCKSSAVVSPGCKPSCVETPGRRSSSADLPRGQSSTADLPRCQSSTADLPRCQSSTADLPRGQSSMADLPRGQSSTADLPRCQSSTADLPRYQSSTVDLPRGHSSTVDLPRGQSSTGGLPGCRSQATGAPGCTSPVADLLGCKSSVVESPERKPLVAGDIPSEPKPKPNRERLSRKWKMKNKAAPVNQDVPCLQAGDSADPVDTEVAKKKSCAWKPSYPVNAMPVKEEECLGKDQSTVNDRMEQIKKTSPGQQKGESLFTAVQSKERNTPLSPSCNTDDNDAKSCFTFSVKRLGFHPSSKVKRPTADEQESPVLSNGYGKESGNELSSGFRGTCKMNMKMEPEEIQSSNDFRSPLRTLTSRANAVVTSASTRSLKRKSSDALVQKKGQSPKVPKVQKAQATTSREQQKRQSLECSQETPIYVKGLYRGRYRNVRRLYSQSQEQSSPSIQSNEWKEECPLEDSSDQELSQFLLQPPSIHPLLHGAGECQKDDDDDDDGSDDMDSSSSDETAFYSSGTSPCLGTGNYPSDGDADDDSNDDQDVFEDDGNDDEDEEMSQFILQQPDLMGGWC